MTADILIITKEIMDIFTKHELSRIQSMFVCEATKMSIQEEITKEIIKEEKEGTASPHMYG